MTQLFNAFFKNLKTFASPFINQIIFYGVGFLLIFIYLFRRDKNTKDNALNQAKVKSYEVQSKNSKIDRYNASKIDNKPDYNEHNAVYGRLRQDGQIRDRNDAK